MGRATASVGHSQNTCYSTREVVTGLSVKTNSNTEGWGINGECNMVNTKLCVVLEIHKTQADTWDGIRLPLIHFFLKTWKLRTEIHGIR